MKPYYDHAGIQIFLGDCREVLPTLPKVDLVLTDPPYGDQAHTPMRRVRATVEGRSEKDTIPFAKLSDCLQEFFVEWCLANCNGWALAFCQAEQVASYSRLFQESWTRPMVWVKPDSAPQFTGDRPAMGYESIALAWCGDGRRKWNGGGSRGVFNYPCGQGNLHPTQKPLALISKLVALFSNDPETILDPFMGSGTTLVAAKLLGRKAIGIEIEEKYAEIAVQRLAQDSLFETGGAA